MTSHNDTITTKQFARRTPQPDGGYFPLTLFTPFSFHPTGIQTCEYREENLHPGVVGLITNALVRYMLSGNKDRSFDFALREKAPYRLNGRKVPRLLLDEIDGLNAQSVCAARQLARFVPNQPKRQDNAELKSDPPDGYTICQVIKMVADTVSFFQKEPMTSIFSTFSQTGKYRVVTGNEYSFLTGDTVWKTHVSFRNPDIKDTLRLMATAILAKEIAGIKRAGIVNMRLRKAYVCDLDDPHVAFSIKRVESLMRKNHSLPRS